MRSVHRLSLVLLVLGAATPLWAQEVVPRPAVPVSRGPRATHAARPDTYGVSAESHFLVPATAFLPEDSSATYTGVTKRHTTASAFALWAPLQLPSGAKIVSLELDYYDNTAASFEGASLLVCDFQGNNCVNYPSAGGGPGDCITSGTICSGTANAPGDGVVVAPTIANDNITIDNFNNQYHLEAYGTTDGSTAVASIIVGYVLQVSPAPATATFTDVPTSDFAFQFIEAFNAAGITVGCNASPPQFCPDRNVTRREMAVFFAKALGLQFP